MKDLAVLARYSTEMTSGELVVESDCAIYYQRTGGSEVDVEFEESFQVTNTLKMEDVGSTCTLLQLQNTYFLENLQAFPVKKQIL